MKEQDANFEILEVRQDGSMKILWQEKHFEFVVSKTVFYFVNSNGILEFYSISDKPD